jgi:signal transduction histidine kinase
MTLIASIVGFFTEPSHEIEDEEQRRQARILSILMFLGTVNLGIALVAGGENVLISAVLGGLAYFLSRTRYYEVARWLGVLLFALPPFVTFVQVADQGTFAALSRLYWVAIPILFISLVSSVRDTVIITALLALGILALALFFPAMDSMIWIASLGFLSTVAAFIIPVTVLRQAYLAQTQRSLQELRATHAELEQVNEQLVREVAEREEIQAELAEARDQAVEALTLKSQILANVSHDARTPLSVIMLRVQMMQSGHYGTLNDQQQQVLSGMLLSANELLNFIENLLQESKLSTTKPVKPGKTAVPIASWLSGYIETMQPLADQKGLKLTSYVADDLPPILYTDITWLKHILNNLIGNAIKFTAEGSVTVRCRLQAADHWRIEVEDTGPGIPEELHDKIFDSFWQADGSITRSVGRGVGLGLSIVRNLVHLMKGEVQVASQPGQGSVFSVILPLEKELENA